MLENSFFVEMDNLCFAFDHCPIPCAAFRLIRNEIGEAIDFTFIYANEAVAVLENMKVEDIIDQNYYELFTNANMEDFNVYADVATNGGSSYKRVYVPNSDKYVGIWCYYLKKDYCICSIFEEQKDSQSQDNSAEDNNNIDDIKAVIGENIVNKTDDTISEEDAIITNILEERMKSDIDRYGIIDVDSGVIKVSSISERGSRLEYPQEGKYSEENAKFIEKYIIETSREDAEQRLSLSNIIKQLDSNNKYICTFSIVLDDVLYRKTWEFRYMKESTKQIIYLCTDVTDLFQNQIAQQRKLNDALMKARKANDAKTEFLSTMSHDIRTPLNAIVNMIKFTKQDYVGTGSGDVMDDLNRLENASTFLYSLINDILDVSKIESGKIVLNPEVYEMDNFYKYFSSVFEPLAMDRHIKINWINDTRRMVVFVDKLRMNQIFFNIISNAIKYTNEGGSITCEIITNDICDDTVSYSFKVTDTGCGMSEEFQRKLFEPYEREFRRDDSSVGTGLGMYIVKKIVDLMGGKVKVSSEVGEGTTIEVYLQLKIASGMQIHESEIKIKQEEGRTETEQDESISDMSTDIKKLEGRHILVAEDKNMNMMILERLLVEKKIFVEKALNGQEALDLFKNSEENWFDIILMDVRMPVMNGIEVTKSIRKLERKDAMSVPIIALSADAYIEDIKETSKAGMNEHLTKPVDPDKLFETIQRFLR